jgi:hypothetical protein
MTTVSILRPPKIAPRRVDALQHAIELVEARQSAEAIAPERVEADGEPVKAGVLQRVRMRGEQHAVGGQREVESPSASRRAVDERPAGRGGAAARRPSAGPCRRRARGRRRPARSISSKCRMSSRGSHT